MSKAGELLQRMEEVSPEKVLKYWFSSKKKVHRKLDCPPGFILDGTACKKLSAQELRKYKKAARKRLKKLRGKEQQIAKKRLRSLARRSAMKGSSAKDVGRTG